MIYARAEAVVVETTKRGRAFGITDLCDIQTQELRV
jgi:hypothetical protein